MNIRFLGLTASVVVLAGVAPALAQQDYVEGTLTEAVTSTDAYMDAEAAADPSAYGTNEGDSEWNSNVFDGTTSTGTYEDPGTLQPGGMTITPNE